MGPFTLSDEHIKHFNISEHAFLNHGGQKTVFKVTIENKVYALKLIHFVDARFSREVKISKEFEHIQGLPSIRKIEEIGGRTVILEDYIEGIDLSESLDRFIGQESLVCSLIFKITEILSPIWQANYVHRDLKPQNIRLCPDGNPYILDFGIARALGEESITATGNQPLSWLYASPEQYEGDKKLISYRTDFFSLGVVTYRLFTGHLPFGDTREDIQKTFNSRKLIVETNSARITNFCNQILSYYPSQRPRTIELFKNLIKI